MPGKQAITLRFTGAFSLAGSVSLASSAAFASKLSASGSLEAAVLLEGAWRAVGARVTPHSDRLVLEVWHDADDQPEEARSAVEAMLSLDVDGVGFAKVGVDNPFIGALQHGRPGVRPILLGSPYETAARAVIGHRIPVRQAATIQARIANELGDPVRVGDRIARAFPAPERLAKIGPIQGLSARKIDQLRALGTAAGAGLLDRKRLRALNFADASLALQQLPGIGPFSAELIWMRGVGDADAFPRTELRLHRTMKAAYGLGEDANIAELEAVAERWRPYRNWAGLLLRNATADELSALVWRARLDEISLAEMGR